MNPSPHFHSYLPFISSPGSVRNICRLLCLTTVLLACVAPAAAQTTYTITDLGVLGGMNVRPAINDSGQVAGEAQITNNGPFHAFVISPPYTGGIDLGTLGGTYSYAQGINDSGQVTGFAQTTDNAAGHAFVIAPPYTAGTMTDLGTLGGGRSVGHGINASGQVTGEATTTNNATFHSFVISPPYTAGTMIDLGNLGGSSSVGYAINASGQVAGEAQTTNASHAFVISPPYTAGTMIDLGTLGGVGAGASVGYSINGSGQVTGYSRTTNNAAIHAFVISPPYTTMTDIGTLGGISSKAYAINDSGQIVGYSGTTNNAGTHAFLWSSAGGMVDLDKQLPANSGWTLLYAFSINNSGEITGEGINPSGLYDIFLLSPVFKAFVQPPITADGSSTFGANRGVLAVKFTLKANDAPTCTLLPATIAVTRTAGGPLGLVDARTYAMAADNGSNFRIDRTACQYVYNLASRNLGTGIYRVDILINSLVVGSAVFGLD